LNNSGNKNNTQQTKQGLSQDKSLFKQNETVNKIDSFKIGNLNDFGSVKKDVDYNFKN
jgi:hypothetical protein